MASVQFYGRENVLAAAENLACPAWAIFISPSLMFTKYQGTDMQESLAMLDKNLEALEQNNTAGIYTLKFFEAEKNKPIKITTKSVCDGGAFNFKLMTTEERERNIISGSSQYGELSKMRKDIEDLKAMLTAPPEPEPEQETLGSVFFDLLKQPERLASLVNVGRSLLGMPVVQPSPSIGSVMPEQEIEENRVNDLERLGKAVDTLEKSDPNFINHMEKLAAMAREKPDQFNMALQMLE